MAPLRYEAKIQESILNVFKTGHQRLFRNAVRVPRMTVPNRSGRMVGVGGKGGSDLVGWASIEITPEMVGQKVAVFCAVEVKRKGPSAAPLSPEQARFIQLVQRAGGRAGVADNLPDARRIMDGKNPLGARS